MNKFMGMVDYAPASRWSQVISLHWKKTLLISLATFTTVLVSFFSRDIWHAMSTLYWQNECSQYSLPDSTLVYSEDNAKDSDLAKNTDLYSSLGPIREAQFRVKRVASPCWGKFIDSAPMDVAPSPGVESIPDAILFFA